MHRAAVHAAAGRDRADHVPREHERGGPGEEAEQQQDAAAELDQADRVGEGVRPGQAVAVEGGGLLLVAHELAGAEAEEDRAGREAKHEREQPAGRARPAAEDEVGEPLHEPTVLAGPRETAPARDFRES